MLHILFMLTSIVSVESLIFLQYPTTACNSFNSYKGIVTIELCAVAVKDSRTILQCIAVLDSFKNQ